MRTTFVDPTGLEVVDQPQPHVPAEPGGLVDDGLKTGFTERAHTLRSGR